MKFVTAKENLLGLIDHADAMIERRNTIPILSHLIFKAENEALTVIASDLDNVVRNTLQDVQVQSDGEIAIPSATFTAMLRKLPSGKPITIETTDRKVTIRAGNSRFQLPTLPADQLPLIDRPTSTALPISTEAFNRALKMVRHSISTEETRYYLNGVYLEIKDGELLAVSTDGHRLSVARICDVDVEQPHVIIPRKPVNQLIKILDQFEGSVGIIIENNKIEFQFGDLVITSKLIDGTFPDYARVIPTDTPIEIFVCPRALGQAIDRVSVVSHEKTRGVTLTAENGSIKLEMHSPDMGTASEEISAQVSAPFRAGYNGRYLKDILDCYAGCETVRMAVKGAEDPAIISPPSGAADKSIIMPMRT